MTEPTNISDTEWLRLRSIPSFLRHEATKQEGQARQDYLADADAVQSASDILATVLHERDELLTALSSEREAGEPRPEAEWHEDHGPVLWWLHPVAEPPYCGTPFDSDWPFDAADASRLWWTPINGNRVHDAISARATVNPHQKCVSVRTGKHHHSCPDFRAFSSPAAPSTETPHD